MNEKSIVALSCLDPEFGRIIKKIGPVQFRRKKTKDAFEALVEAVVCQQLTAKAAATIFARVKALYPDQAFPTCHDLLATPIEKLREAGLSRSKAASIHDIAQKSLDGQIPSMKSISKMNEEEIIESLTCVRGVGRWTAEMFLISIVRTKYLSAEAFNLYSEGPLPERTRIFSRLTVLPASHNRSLGCYEFLCKVS